MTIYSLVHGRLKEIRFTIVGVMVDGVGYALASNRWYPSIPITVSRLTVRGILS